MKNVLRPTLVLIALAVLVLPAILLYPLNMDNDVLQSQGLELFRHVGLPFLGSWDQNFPGTVLLHWFAISLFGKAALGFRFFEFLWQMATMAMLYKVSRLWLRPTTALLGSGLYAIFYVHGPLTLMGQRDGFATLPMLLAIFILVNRSRGVHPRFQSAGLVLAGVLFGFAVAIRPTFILLIPIAPFTLWNIRDKSGRTALLLLVSGALIVAFTLLLAYAFQSHGLKEAFLATIRYNLDIYARMPTEKISGRIFFAFAILLAWISVAIFHKRTGRRISEAPQFSNERWFLTYILLALLAGVIVQRKFLSYHYIPFFTLCWPALAAVWMEYSRHLSRWSRPATGAMVLVAVVALYPWKLVLHYVRSGFSLSSTNEYVLPDPIYGVRAQQAISDYVDQRTRPNERVEFASFFPGPRWRIDRLEATRFTSLLPLLPQTPNHHYTSYQIRWRAEFVDQLQLLKPQYIVIQEIPDPAHTTSERFTPVFERMFKIPGLSELLESQYHKDTTFDSCTFYRRNGS